ncbi:MAG: hypothetical protein IPL23_08090 [Saprospiraceae bacterium]|nr:hypothetical protein [Saprospiraceae bacterium]
MSWLVKSENSSQFADPNIYQIWVYKKVDKRAPSLHQIVDPSRNQTFAEDDLPAENENVFLLFASNI